MANISTLTVSLVAETAKFTNGLKKAKKSSGAFGKAVGKSMKFAAAGVAALTAGIGLLVAQSFKLVDEQRKIARTLGITQGEFAGLSLAAGIAGISTQSFSKALKRQSKSIVDASDGLQTQKRALDRLGLSTKQLLKLNTVEQFKLITTALGTIESATIKVAVASDLYGAKNADLINIIDLGAEGIDKYIKKVKELGVALTDKQTKAIEDANDALLIMKTAFTGLGNQIAARLAPSLLLAANKVADLTQNVTDGIPKWTAWAASILGVKRLLDQLTVTDLQEEIKLMNAAFIELRDRRDEVTTLIEKTGGEKGIFGGSPLLARINEQMTELAERAETARTLLKQLQLTGEVADPTGPLIDGEGGGGTGGKQVFDASKFDDRIQAAKDSVNEFTIQMAKWKAEATAAFNATRDPLENLLIKLKELRENPLIDSDLQNRSIQDAVEKYQAALKSMKESTDEAVTVMSEFQKQAFANMQDILADTLFDPFDKGLDGMLKGFVDMLRKMVAQLLAQKILTSFFSAFGIGTPGIGDNTGTGGGGFKSFAIGGQVRRGQTVKVGERGTELFTPGASGSIRPLGSVSFAPVTTIGGGGDGLTIATLIPILEANNKRVMADFLDSFDRGAFS